MTTIDILGNPISAGVRIAYAVRVANSGVLRTGVVIKVINANEIKVLGDHASKPGILSDMDKVVVITRNPQSED